jgi:hypothetical protein
MKIEKTAFLVDIAKMIADIGTHQNAVNVKSVLPIRFPAFQASRAMTHETDQGNRR